MRSWRFYLSHLCLYWKPTEIGSTADGTAEEATVEAADRAAGGVADGAGDGSDEERCRTLVP